ncbi:MULTISPECIES: GntR family transcriptional regulator [Brucella/Ochrobactrum group]|uniref:GntR family transcriptional regulator n=1 Tax=Brucella pseudintermedia TaxID=370111 RepID=A0ABY5UES1_9HYPH|nr:GntR family transcriptional regulator [Brucella pseudintermedia]UWL61855.1 GntR family transcriptional regulator [Brucella pseudintermedia]
MERPKETGIERLRTGILDLIQEMNLSLGDKLPTEKVMAERFHVSRPTLREALKLLEQEAVIDVHQGKGRFVAAGAALSIARPITKFESVSEMVRSHGYRAQTHLLSFATVPAPQEIANKLAVPAGSPLVKVERLRKSSGQPLIYSIDWIPKTIAGILSEADTDWNGSIVELLARIDKAPVASTASVSSVEIPEEARKLHELEEFGPALLIEEICFSSDGSRVIFAKDYHRGSAFSFSFVRK